MSENNTRDTHFQHFAELLYEELVRNTQESTSIYLDTETFKQEQHTIIARRAYDLACHVLYETGYGFDLFNIPDRVKEDIPDMTTWPEKTK